MDDLDLYRHALTAVERGDPAVLVVVVDAEGSVPGTPGAAMLVLPTLAVGTVGGGIAEARMIERARAHPPTGVDLTEFRHSEESLCSGTQTLALAKLGPADTASLAGVVERLAVGETAHLTLSPSGLGLADDAEPSTGFRRTASGWRFDGVLGLRDVLVLIGGGHVSLALSRVAATLPYRIAVFDDRANLPTLDANQWAHERRVVDYAEIARHVPEGEHSWVVIMTHGHHGDRKVLEHLVGLDLRYLGLLGSRAKIAAILSALAAAGIDRARLDRVHAPVGLEIGSHTPAEIAVSIAAELIRERNLKRQ
jgi:xanthine dehydrogenase accessory factor